MREGGREGRRVSVRILVCTDRVLVAPNILSIYERMEGNSQKLDENGRKKERKKVRKKKERKE
jgi:hypothetical protein